MRKKRNEELSQFMLWAEGMLLALKPTLEHGREMTEEFNEFPSQANKMCMDMARSNVLVAIEELTAVLLAKYAELSNASKKQMTITNFKRTIHNRLVSILNK